MGRTVRVLASILFGRHPAPDILQACADRELNALAHRLAQLHVRGCKACQQEMRSGDELLALLDIADAEPEEVSAVRDKILLAMAAASDPQQQAQADLRRLLGRRAADRAAREGATPELRLELAGFLGDHAAESFLHRLAS